ncbi:MAG: beta-N-acetylhexosaminidase [Acidobacteriia bacterium]|nr:beta-N-acetylhexosaminidase [Terriglobia bacterium]
MNHRFLLALLLLSAVCGGAAAQADSDASALHLLPAPKAVRLSGGKFVVGPATRILLDARHAAEDRTAAEMLAEDIREQSGRKVPIETVAAPAQGGGAIVLGRLGDRGVRAALRARGVKPEEQLGSQGYVIVADASRILVAGNTGQGLFYGVQTLRQMLHPEGKGLACPAGTLQDWPSMEWRGVHDDISRGPIPTLEYVKKQVRTLAGYKVNLVSLYMEHVFDFQSHPLVAPKEAALTPEKIRDLVAYARKYYVTILPEQQGFGHLHHVLKYEQYAGVAETPHGHVLTPTKEASYDIIRSFYGELAPLFPGPLFHIGADETFELGTGQTKARAAEVGLGRVYLEHLQKVHEIMQPYHKRLLFWGDIAVKYPELLGMLPKEMVAVPWDYSARAEFETLLKPFHDAGLVTMVAPGANNWSMIWPDLDTAYVNIRNFVRDGQKYGSLGVLNTTWNDDGEALYEMTWPALVFGAAAGWQPGESSIEQFKAGYDWAFYRNEDSTFGDALENLDRTHALLRKAGFRGAEDDLFWNDPFSDTGAKMAQKALPVAGDLRMSAEAALSSLYRNRQKARANAGTVDALIFAALRLDTLGMKIQFTQEINGFYADAWANQTDKERVGRDLAEITGINARLEDLRDATTRLRELYAQNWQRENYSYWLPNVLVRYDNLAREMQAKIVAVRQAEVQYRQEKTLPSPQQLGLFPQPAAN